MADGVPLRVAVIGCGYFGRLQLAAWDALDGVEVAAVCDLDPARAHHPGAVSYAEAPAMLATEALDFVDIATRVETHRQLVELVAAHRLPVICQKPFAADRGDAEAMVSACAKAGVTLMVHENFRWQAPMRAVREVIEQGGIGAPSYARISFRHAHDIYTNQPYLREEPRLALMDVGTHALDLARFFMGEADRVYARSQRIDPTIKGEDVVDVVLDHAGGTVSLVDLSFSTVLQPDPFPQTLVRIEGTTGTVELLSDYTLRVSSQGQRQECSAEPEAPDFAPAPRHVIAKSVVAVQRHWLETLRAGTEPDTSGADNLKTLDLVFRAYESAATGRAL